MVIVSHPIGDDQPLVRLGLIVRVVGDQCLSCENMPLTCNMFTRLVFFYFSFFLSHLKTMQLISFNKQRVT